MITDEMKQEIAKSAPFGLCPWCGEPLAWVSNELWHVDETVTVRYLNCPHCGADIEALQCVPEELRRSKSPHEFHSLA